MSEFIHAGGVGLLICVNFWLGVWVVVNLTDVQD